MRVSTTPSGVRSTDVTNLQVSNELWVRGSLYFGTNPDAPAYIPPEDILVYRAATEEQLVSYGSVASGVLTLPGDRVYVIAGIMVPTTFSRIVVSPGSIVAFVGSGIGAIVLNTASDAITIGCATFLTSDVNFYNIGTGHVVSHTGTTGLLLERTLFESQSGTSADGIRTAVTSGGNVIVRACASKVSAGRHGIVCTATTGTGRTCNIELDAMSGGTVDLGTSVWKSVLIHNSVLDLSTGVSCITGAATSGNIHADGFGSIQMNVAVGTGGTALTNIEDADDRWVVANNCGFTG